MGLHWTLTDALRRAKVVAAMMGHKSSEPYHLLIALYLEDNSDNLVRSALDRFAFNLDTAFMICNELQPPDQEGVQPKDVMHGRNLLVTLSYATKFAHRDGDRDVRPCHVFEAMLRMKGDQTPVLEAFAPSRIIYEEAFVREWEKPIVNQVTIEEL